MVGYYAVNDTNDPVALGAAGIRKLEYQFWCSIRPELDTEFEVECHTLSTLTGVGERRAKDIVVALVRLDELPQLKALQERLFHLDLNRLIAIDSALNRLGQAAAEVMARIDAALTRYLTATRPNQKLPSARAIRAKIAALVSQEDRSLKKPEETKKDEYFTEPLPGGRSAIGGEYDSDVAAILDEHIRQTAERLEISPAEALARLISGEAYPQANVILHVYRARDVANAPAFIRGVGWVHPDVADKLKPNVIRDMDKAAEAESKSYVTPSSMASFVEGRDGTCRWPGCSRPAHESQKDHRIDFRDGGPTAARNLASLCQHHHNVKTDGRAFYVLDPITGDIVWLFENGHWEYDEASGPLAPKNRNWAQSVGEAITARRERAYQRAKKDSDSEED